MCLRVSSDIKTSLCSCHNEVLMTGMCEKLIFSSLYLVCGFHHTAEFEVVQLCMKSVLARWHASDYHHQNRPSHPTRFQGQSWQSVSGGMKYFCREQPVLAVRWSSLSHPCWLYWSGLDPVESPDSKHSYLWSSTPRNLNTEEDKSMVTSSNLSLLCAFINSTWKIISNIFLDIFFHLPRSYWFQSWPWLGDTR